MYRDWRINPIDKPFNRIALDYAGPYRAKFGQETKKVYILVITCLYTRAINLEISVDMTTKEFLRSLQLHCHKFGLPSFVMNDLGSNLVQGANIIKNYLSDPLTTAYFEENGCKPIEFYQYFKGHHELGSTVEICVKAVKRLISGAIGNNVLPIRDLEYTVSQSVHLVNRRPIAFQESLREGQLGESMQEVITPELLLHGFNLTSINVIPALQQVDIDDLCQGEDFDPLEHIRDVDKKLRNVRSKLLKMYHEEFIPQMIKQATDRKSRYCPKKHNKLQVNDLVLLREDNVKVANMPMGKVLEIVENNLGEVTSAVVLKGGTKERVKRHVCGLIPLLQQRNVANNSNVTRKEVSANQEQDRGANQPVARPRRHAAVQSTAATRRMLTQ